jgi:hypothetical protein
MTPGGWGMSKREREEREKKRRGREGRREEKMVSRK